MKRDTTWSDANHASRAFIAPAARKTCKTSKACKTLAAGLLLAAVAAAPSAEARGTIKEVGNHPDYSLDLEFHFALSLLQGPYPSSGTGFGPGGRITVPVLQNGFIKTINNSIAVSAGLDWIHFGSVDRETVDYFFIPIVMQWNFWLTEDWSVFGEPGLSILLRTQEKDTATPVINGGARWLLTDGIAMVFRAGYPVVSVGFSFLQ